MNDIDDDFEKKIVQLGSISFVYDESDDGDEKDSSDKDKCDLKNKITFDGTKETLCLQSSKKDKANLSILKEKASYYALYLRMNEKSSGYYYDEKTYELIIVQELDKGEFLAYLAIVDVENGEEFEDVIEEHFRGESSYRIEESYSAIKKEFCKDSTKIKLILIVGLFLVAVALIVSTLFEDEPLPPPPPPPSYPNLSKQTVTKIKTYASKDMLKNLEKLVNEIETDELLNSGKQRVVVYTQAKPEVLVPEKPVVRADGSYYYKNKDMVEGAVVFGFNLSYQIAYPKVGYTLSGKGIYVKEEQKKYTYFPKEVKNFEFKKLTKQCIDKSLKIAPKDTFVYERDKTKINFKFKNLKASDFIKRTKDVIEECPTYLEDISLNNGQFQGSLVLYAPERL